MSLYNRKVIGKMIAVICLFWLPFILLATEPSSGPSKEDYLTSIKKAGVYYFENYDELMQKWEKSYSTTPITGHRTPWTPSNAAEVLSFLYSVSGERVYAEVSRRALLSYHKYAHLFPEIYRRKVIHYVDGVPPIASYWQLLPYIQSYNHIKDSDVLDAEDKKIIEETIANSADFCFDFHEWGAHNRAIWAAAALEAASKAIPDHPRATKWSQLATYIANDSWGKWTIEDAENYNPIWLYGLILYAEASEREGLFNLETTHYYLNYFVNLLSPSGMLADFGDANWQGGWWRCLICLERGATEYRDPYMKYVAQKIYETMIKTDPPEWVYTYLVDAYRWCDDSIEPKVPTTGSREVLEDMIGKKIVFRNGWESESTFLLLNYRDEGDYGLVQRDYLRTSIPVEAEKMHHGHADENSICLIMSGGSVLLHDSGYREVSTNGAFRADMYHNRIVARGAVPGKEQPITQFLHDAGHYKPVSTEKIHFFTFTDVDVSRTRLTDDDLGYRWDRIVTYLKKDDLFILFDSIKILKPGIFNFSNLLYTQRILDVGEHWYDTRIERIEQWNNPQNRDLLIYFPQAEGKREGAEEVRRSYTTETCIYQTTTQVDSMNPGDMLAFVTVLYPHQVGETPEKLLTGIKLFDLPEYPHAVALRIEREEQSTLICARLDLEMEFLTENIRPKYTFERGKVDFGRLLTDARWAYVKESKERVDYAFIEATKLIYGDKVFFAAKPFGGFTWQPDGKFVRSGIRKWECWEGSEKR